MLNQSKKEKSSKYESLTIKEQMLGVKSSQALPDDFYEKVLECELNLKEKFDMNILGELIKYYSLAVEHFASIGDEEKCAEYNDNLNLLFKQMEIKKYMQNGHSMELNAKKEEIKQEMKMAENNIDIEEVKKKIKEKIEIQIKPKKSIILKEIFNQALTFKQKLENKKKKYQLKLNLESINASNISKNKTTKNKNPMNIDGIFFNKKRISKSTKNKKNIKIFEESTLDNTFIFSFKSEKNLIINDISLIKNKNKKDLSKDDSEDLLSSIELNLCDDSSDIKLNLSARSSKILPSFNKNDCLTKITEKKNFQKKIKTIISNFMQEYYIYYMNNIIEKIVKDYEKNSYHLSEELMEDEVNYYNQERQIEYLKDEDEKYNEQIEGTLKSIKKKKKKKIGDIYEKYNKNIKNINDNYLFNSARNFKQNKIELLKEKMKLEITKEINNSVLT